MGVGGPPSRVFFHLLVSRYFNVDMYQGATYIIQMPHMSPWSKIYIYGRSAVCTYIQPQYGAPLIHLLSLYSELGTYDRGVVVLPTVPIHARFSAQMYEYARRQ